MTFKDKLLGYLYNTATLVETDYIEHLHYMRFHHVDEVDCMETIILKTRRDCFNEILRQVVALLGTK